jgi:hypothetical protein
VYEYPPPSVAFLGAGTCSSGRWDGTAIDANGAALPRHAARLHAQHEAKGLVGSRSLPSSSLSSEPEESAINLVQTREELTAESFERPSIARSDEIVDCLIAPDEEDGCVRFR